MDAIRQPKVIVTLLGGAAVAGIVIAAILRRKREGNTITQHKSAVPSSDDKIIITEVHVYPMKGAQGMSVKQWPLTSQGGLLYDREWALIDAATHTMIGDKKAIANIRAEVDLAKNIVRFSSSTKSNSTLEVSTDHVESTKAEGTSERLHIDRLGCACWVDTIPMASQWFSDVVGQPVLLIRPAKDGEGRKPHEVEEHKGAGSVESDRMAFQAFSHLHIVSEEGMQWLASTVRQRNPDVSKVDNAALEMSAEKFRANLVVRNTQFPDEDRWLTAQIAHPASSSSSPIHLRFAKHCARCIVPTFYQPSLKQQRDDGQQVGQDEERERTPHQLFEPTRTLRAVRGCRYSHMARSGVNESPVEGMFGTEWFVEQVEKEEKASPRVIVVGDTVDVLTRQEAPIFL